MNSKFAALVVLTLVFSAWCTTDWGQPALSIQSVEVIDAVNAVECHENFGTFHFKGHGDGSLSPGERVSLRITLKNELGVIVDKPSHDGRDCLGVLSTNNSYVLATSAHCYSGLIGVPFSCPIDPGSTATNNGIFSLDISQSLPCDQSVEFSLFLTYWTQDGACGPSGCTQTLKFSLPVFDVTKPYDVGAERDLLPDWDSRQLNEVASSGKDLGVWFSQGFAITDLDLNQSSGVFYFGGAGTYAPSHRALLWNPSGDNSGTANSWYECFWKSDNDWDDSGTIYGIPATSSYSSGYAYDTTASSGPLAAAYDREHNRIGLLYVYYDNFLSQRTATLELIRTKSTADYPANVPYVTVSGRIPLGQARRGSWTDSWTHYVQSRFSLAYLEGSGTTPSVMYAAWEDHDIVANVHNIKLCRVRMDTWQVMGTWTVSVTCGRGPAAPSLAVDPKNRRVGLVWQDAPWDPLDAEPDLFFQLFSEALAPLGPQLTVVETPAGWGANSPTLLYKNGFCVGWLETKKAGTSTSSRARLAFIDASNPTAAAVTGIQYLSSEWMNMGSLGLCDAVDRLYVTWFDQRDSVDRPCVMKSAGVLPVNDAVPINVNTEDDPIVSQSYQLATHPVLASQGDEFLLAWCHGTNPSPPDGDIYISRYSASENPLETWTCISGGGGLLDGMKAGPLAVANSGNYYVYWCTGVTLPTYAAGDIRRARRFSGSVWESPSILVSLEHAEAKMLDAAVSAAGSEALLFQDWRSSDTEMNLYLYSSDGAGTTVRVTACSDSTPDAFLGGGLAYTGDFSVPWVVAWWEVAYISDSNPHWGRVLKLARFDTNLVQVGATVLLDESPSSGTAAREVSVTVSGNRIMVLYEANLDAGGFSRVLRLWKSDLEGVFCDQESLASGVGTGDWFLFKWPHIRWSGTEAIASWAGPGAERMSGTTLNLFTQWFSDFGDPLGWPVRIGSPIVRMLAYERGNLAVASTRLGGVAAYARDSVSSEVNTYMTMLSWPDGATDCSMYNQAPTISTTGPYSVEFGSSVALSGADWDDDRGDYVVSRGWDLSDDGVVDVSGNSTVLTKDLMVRNKIVAPKLDSQYYNIRFSATDSHGATRWLATQLYVTDHTPPAVSVNYPNGGETLRFGQTVTVTWDGSDNFELKRWDAYYSTNYGDPGGEVWQPLLDASSNPAANLSPAVRSFDWVVPDVLSATCRIKVVGADGSPLQNSSFDISDHNFYIAQVTTTAIRTLVLYNSARTDSVHGTGASGPLFSKLTELANHTKVNGVVLDLNNVAGLGALYSTWDTSSLDLSDAAKRQANVEAANAVANAIRDYVVGQVAGTYTNTEYLVLAGDDRIVPFYRVVDGTANYPETNYAPFVNVATPVGAAADRKYYLTDAIFGDMDYDITEAGMTFLALPDLATGRLVETPAEIATTVNAFIAQDGQINLNKVLVTGYDFLDDSASAMMDTYVAAGKTVDHLITPPDDTWGAAEMEAGVFSSPAHALCSFNNHADHANFGTPGTALSATQMDTHAAGSLRGTLLYSVGCHSGLSAPDGDFGGKNPLDLPQVFLRKGAAAYVGNTGYGWGLKFGSGYSERLAEMITTRLLSQQSSALGKALAEAKRDYFIQDHRYDVFDEKVLFECTLFGLPMYKVVVSSAAMKPPEDEVRAEGPDEQEARGILMKKDTRSNQGALPTGVTELTLNFDFSAAYGSQMTTLDGSYWRLNGRCNAELGDTLQPYFTYDSRLSGTVSHGVLFTGGAFTTQGGFDPVVASPQSSTYEPASEGPLGPASGSFIPTVNATHPQLPSSLVLTELTRMTVSTGYFEAGPLPGAADDVETKFNTMNFVMYYSNSSDKTAPEITDPGEMGTLHTLNGLTATFSVPVTDASGVYRVVVVHTDKVSEWKSMDLSYNASSGKWEGSLLCKKNIIYHVQAVDSAGNVGFLKQSGSDKDGNNTDTGSTWVAGRLFTIALADTDGDGMPNAYETANGLNPNSNDSGLDPDYDGLSNFQEFNLDTLPQKGDTDGDGENDGSEVNHNGSGPVRNPLVAGDGKRTTVMLTLVNGDQDVKIDWPAETGDNGVIDGPYWVYRSLDPFFDASEELVTLPSKPLADGTVTYTDAGGGAGPTYYYTVTNVRYTGPAPVVVGVLPNHGHATDMVWVLVNNLQAGATVTFGSAPATNVTVINGTTLTCTVPAGSGTVRVTVTNPNGQFGYLDSAFNYDP